MSLINLFLAPPPPVWIGVDIGSTSVKMVELEKTGDDNYRVRNYVIEPLLLSTNQEENAVKTTSALKAGWARLKTKTTKVAISLSSSNAFTKKIYYSKEYSEDELYYQIEENLTNLIEYRADEVDFDFQIVGTNPKNEEEYEILLAFARKSVVKEVDTIIQNAGLQVASIDLEPFYLGPIIKKILHENIGDDYFEKCIALVDIGGTNVKINIMSKESVVYSKEIQFGGDALNEYILNVYQVFGQELDALKEEKIKNFDSDFRNNVITPYLETLAVELRRSFDLFFSSTPFNLIDALVFFGGVSNLPGVTEIIGKHANVKTIFIANPFVNMDFSKNINAIEIQNQSGTLLPATSLALRRFSV